MGDVTPFPKSRQLARGERRYRRKVASPKQWQAIRAAKCAGSCRICETSQVVALPGFVLESHHLVPRDRHGDDVPDNIIGLCEPCHRGVELREPAHCRLMLTRLSDAEYAYAIRDDTLDDIFPGTGSMGQAWRSFQAQPPLFEASRKKRTGAAAANYDRRFNDSLPGFEEQQVQRERRGARVNRQEVKP